MQMRSIRGFFIGSLGYLEDKDRLSLGGLICKLDKVIILIEMNRDHEN